MHIADLKETLPDKVPNSECFHYVQIVYFFKSLQCVSDLINSTSMEYLYRSFDKHTGHISKMYNILTSKSEKLFYMTKWEQDIGETIKIDEWSQCASKLCINTSLIKANYKVLMRWYMGPVRVAAYVTGASLSCF